jgi:hypothetical protein
MSNSHNTSDHVPAARLLEALQVRMTRKERDHVQDCPECLEKILVNIRDSWQSDKEQSNASTVFSEDT